MAGYEIVHVAVAPPDTLEADLIKKVAAVVNKEPHDTHLPQVGEIPRIITQCQDTSTAKSLAQSLRGLGLVAFVCTDSELRQPSQSLKAHTLEFGEREVVFRDNRGQARKMGAENVFLILKGKIQTEVETEAIKTKMKLNLAATMLTGIPIRRKVTEKTPNRSFQTECLARLYDRKSAEPSVDILQRSIDYSFLGQEIAYSSLANFNTVITKLQEIFPKAIFDDRLMKTFKADVPCTRVQDNLEINCKLLYLYHLARDLSLS